jgi:hypothetical protein
VGEPRTDVCAFRGVVQFRPRPSDAEDDAGRCGGIGERSVGDGAAVERVGEDLS